MRKEESKNTDLQNQNDDNQQSRNDQNENRDQQVLHDRSARHLSEIDRREGEMNHGETGLRSFDQPDNRA